MQRTAFSKYEMYNYNTTKWVVTKWLLFTKKKKIEN
jgi:hypothetical protein